MSAILSSLEESGYLSSLAEATTEEEDEGVPVNVEEDYDVIEDRDVPSPKEVQVGVVVIPAYRWVWLSFPSIGGCGCHSCLQVGVVFIPAYRWVWLSFPSIGGCGHPSLQVGVVISPCDDVICVRNQLCECVCLLTPSTAAL